MQIDTPNLEKLAAVIRAIGPGANVSYQDRDPGLYGKSSGFFTVTFWPAGDQTRCAIGQADDLAGALTAARADAAALLTKVSIADLEKVAA